MHQGKDRPTRRIRRICVLLGVLLLPIPLGLGFWQLDRADQKQQLLDRLERSPSAIQLPKVDVPMPYPLKIEARLDTRYPLLLDNRTREGRVGYELLLPFEELVSGLYGVVNLGWIAAPTDRRQLPELDSLLAGLDQGSHLLSGLLVSPDRGFMLAEDQWSEGWPKRIQQVDLLRLEGLWQQPLHNAVLRLRQPLIAADTNWSVSVMPPYKHHGYALQWFSLALLLAGYLFWWGWRRPLRKAALKAAPDSVQGGRDATL